MATITIGGQPYTVQEGQNLLHACLSLGFDIPYFCWHPALQSVGACRQCAVKQFRDEHDTRGRIVMACMTPANDGTRISIEDPEAKAFRAAAIEWLMVNHPHDCPVCDEGGECHLQDMTVMTGHTHRRFRFRKRTHRNQYLGPFVNHEMNRCIACYRCVRFYRDVAGGRDLDVFGAHHQVYFGRAEDGVLESEFSGNLVEICPTGVFTDKTLKRHYTRKWDLQTAPSVCVHCGLGCNTIPGARYGSLRRIYARYNDAVNGYFLCDRGRFGYEFVNHERRLRQPLRRGEDGELSPVTKQAALEAVGQILRESKGVIGIGSPRASLESSFALRALVGAERFHQGMSEIEQRLVATAIELLRHGPARTPSLSDLGEADAVLVLGEDVTNTAPMMALQLRQDLLRREMKIAGALHIPKWDDASVREAAERAVGPVFDQGTIEEAGRRLRASIFLATPCCTRLDDAAVWVAHAPPDDLARWGRAIAHAIDPSAPAVDDLSSECRGAAEQVARALIEGEQSMVVSGCGARSEAVMRAAAAVAWALCHTQRCVMLSLVTPECNSMGVGLLGGGDLAAAAEALRSGAADTLIVVENDLYRRGERAEIDALLEAAEHVIVVDHLANETTAQAEVVLPAATFAEGSGTLVNNEGRAQRFFKVMTPEDDVQESWRWVRDMAIAAGRDDLRHWRNLDAVIAALAEALPDLAGVREAAPDAGFRAAGQRIPRQSHRTSGRTAMTAQIDVHEPPPNDDEDSALGFSMEGYEGDPPAALLARVWAPGWNSVQAISKFQQEVGGPLRGGPAGKRLIGPKADAAPAAGGAIPPAFQPREDEWLVVPVHLIYGSEELSALAPAVAELVPPPFVAVNPSDAERLGVDEGQEVEVAVGGATESRAVRVVPELPPGTLGLPVGLPGTSYVSLPAWGIVRKRK